MLSRRALLLASLALARPARADALAEMIAMQPGMGRFAMILSEADLPALRGDGPFTVLVPTDSAFRFPEGRDATSRLAIGDTDWLRDWLSAHVVPGRFRRRDIEGGGLVLPDLRGHAVHITRTDDTPGIQPGGGRELEPVRINGVAVRRWDLRADNGVAHLLDRVLPL